MNIWQFNVKMKDWADDGSDEYDDLEIGTEFPHYIKGVHKKINNRIGDIVVYYNQKESKKRSFNQGIYLICEIISNVYDEYSIDLKVIKDYRINPYKYDVDFQDLHQYHNTLELRGRIQSFELINDKKKRCDINLFYKKTINYSIKEENVLPEEISPNDSKNLIEGSTKKIIVNAYERNSKARKECIAKYGYSCCVCDFNFKNMYGKIGEDFIHVHHLTPLSKIKEEYEINPIKDLRPVCPNCHAMLHRNKETLSIKELKKIIS